MFCTELKYKLAYLDDARGIVMTSFFSHRTISHLDLQISQRAYFDPREHLGGDFRLAKTFFCTEESLHNSLVPRRRLLYSMNLDSPVARGYSNLRNGPFPMDLPICSDSLFVAVRGRHNFFKRALARLIGSAVERTNSKIKLLKWLVDFRPMESVSLNCRVQYSCSKLLYRECVDSELATKFFGKFVQFEAFSGNQNLKVLEYLLYHARLCDFDVRGAKSPRSSLADFGILCWHYRLVPSFLKYEDTVYYTENSYKSYRIMSFLSMGVDADQIRRSEILMSKLRLYRMLQIIYIFTQRGESRPFLPPFDFQDDSEALRLMWRSIPDPLVTLQEMRDTYTHELPPDILNQAHSFYEETIRQTVSRLEPRALSQYCRWVIRKSLFNSRQWLPEGIRQLKLPPRFESFLNLEIDRP